jgi:hypothetical protein
MARLAVDLDSPDSACRGQSVRPGWRRPTEYRLGSPLSSARVTLQSQLLALVAIDLALVICWGSLLAGNRCAGS